MLTDVLGALTIQITAYDCSIRVFSKVLTVPFIDLQQCKKLSMAIKILH